MKTSRLSLRKKKKKKWWKITLLFLFIIFLLVISLGIFEYYHLKPSNHFTSVPTLSKSDQKTKKGVFNILLLGSDERKGNNIGHSDSIILMHVNLNTNKFSAVSIPRDTRVHLNGYGYTKLTSVQYIKQSTDGNKAGIIAAANSISQLTSVPINYYIETNYEGLQSMVDSLGTIDVDVPFDVKLTHPWYKENTGKVIKAGTQTLDGQMVTELVHERYSLPHGDYDRQLLQQKVLVGMAKTALKPKNIKDLPSLVSNVSDFLIGTNMSKSDIISFSLAVKSINPDKDIKYYQLKGTGKNMYDDVLKNNNSQIVLDENNLKEVMKHFK